MMDSIIQESEVVAELIPEVHYHLLYGELDSPLLESLTLDYLSRLVLFSFFSQGAGLREYHPDWIARLQHDQALIPLAHLPWRKVQVIDNTGTLIIYTQEFLHAQRLPRPAPVLRHCRSLHPRLPA